MSRSGRSIRPSPENSEVHTVISVLDARDAPAMNAETANRLSALTEDEIAVAAASDPDNPLLTRDEIARAGRGTDVVALRKRLGLSQAAFSSRYRIPLATLQDWEQGRRRPDRGASLLLRVIAHDPEMVERALL